VRKNPRSIAYLMSADVTARSTGGEKRTPARRRTVTVLPSGLTSGRAAARSGTGSVALSGLKPSSVRWVARTTTNPLVVYVTPGSSESTSSLQRTVSLPPCPGLLAGVPERSLSVVVE
jgi:hypothetical protein